MSLLNVVIVIAVEHMLGYDVEFDMASIGSCMCKDSQQPMEFVPLEGSQEFAELLGSVHNMAC